MPEMWFVVLIYGVGVLVGLAATDARAAARVVLSLLWPLGPAAFLVTLAVLAAASLIAFPIVGAAVGGALLIFYLLSSL